jgi:hypothetical protein
MYQGLHHSESINIEALPPPFAVNTAISNNGIVIKKRVSYLAMYDLYSLRGLSERPSHHVVMSPLA